MKWNKQRVLIIFSILLVLACFYHLTYAPRNSQTHSLDTEGSDGCYFSFDNDCGLWFDASIIYLGDSNGLWNWIDDNGITIFNLEMGSSDCPSPWTIYLASTTYSNVTVTTLFAANQLSFTIAAPFADVTVTQIYCGTFGRPTSVTGATSWSYNDATNILSVQTNHFFSDINIEVQFQPDYAEAISDTLSNTYTAITLASTATIISMALAIIILLSSKNTSPFDVVLVVVFVAALTIALFILLVVLSGLRTV